MSDLALDGVKWWSLIVLDGYSRTMLAGAVAPTEASWVALMVLYAACLRYGTPATLISDSGGPSPLMSSKLSVTAYRFTTSPLRVPKAKAI
jgi:hypothetical protein